MAKHYKISIDSLVNTFSRIESGKKFDFSIETENTNIKDLDITRGDLIIACIEDKIYYNFEVIDKKDNQLKLKKVFEIEKSIGYGIDEPGTFNEIDQDEYKSLCYKLFNDFVNKDEDLSELNEIAEHLDQFVDWLIEQDGIKNNYYSDSFGSSKERLKENLIKYDNIYKGEFGNTVFSFPQGELIEFIKVLEKNLYKESGEFYSFSEKTSNHMPRAILGKKNYLKFLKEQIGSNFNYEKFVSDCKNSGLHYTDELITRYISSLVTKPFVLLSGLSGSGKTKLAQSFAKWISADKSQYCIVPVGADWINREPLLGYVNAIESSNYILPENGALKLLLNANKESNKNKPYFLILDEMNLSHVERYFADFFKRYGVEREI